MVIHVIFNEKIFFALYEQIFSRIPYQFGVKIRKGIFEKRLGYYGKGVRISHHVKILGKENIFLDDYVRIANHVILDGRKGIKVGKYSMIGFESILLSSTHTHMKENIPYLFQSFEGKEIMIGINVWIGARVIILPGISIGDNSIIGAGSVVTKSFPKNSVLAGNPAQQIKTRNL